MNGWCYHKGTITISKALGANYKVSSIHYPSADYIYLSYNCTLVAEFKFSPTSALVEITD